MNSSDSSSGGQEVILLVDDIPENLQLLSSLLAKEGYNISMAVNGLEALEIVPELKPDLILLDIMMPEMDGFTVCERIKKDDEFKEIPIIFISAKTELVDKVKGFRIGGADYITKPYQSAEVLARVKTQLALKHAQDTIRHHNAQLEEMVLKRTKQLLQAEKHAAFSLFIKGIIHNLKNPLTGIMGNSELCRMYLQMLDRFPEFIAADKQEEYKDTVDKLKSSTAVLDRSSKRLLNLINSLLAKSRSEQTEKADTYDLNELLKQEIGFLDSDLRFKRLGDKNINLSNSSIFIEIIPSDLSQIIQNLVNNALDALGGKQDSRIDISSGENGEFGWLKISDNGPGIPKEIQDSIFDPFFTTKIKHDDDPDDSPAGTGLGLYTCAELVRNFNGTINIVSGPGMSTCFKIEFPLKKP